jgi:hypothetical protein
MIGNLKQKLCLIEDDGEYLGYKDNEEVQDLLHSGWVIKQITGVGTNSTPRCYVLLEKPDEEEIEEIAK